MEKVGSMSKFKPATSKTEQTTSSSADAKKTGMDQFSAAVSSAAAKAASALASAAKEQSSGASGAARGQEQSVEQSVARARIASTDLAKTETAGTTSGGVIATQPLQEEFLNDLRETLSVRGHPNAQSLNAEELGRELAFAGKIEVLGAKLDGSVWRLRAEQGERAAITGAVREVFNIPSDVKIDDVPAAVGFAANVEALGGERTEQLWRDFGSKGADAVLGGLVRDTFGIPNVGTEGMSAKDLLGMAADGHKIGVYDFTTGFVSDWQNYRSGATTGQAIIDKWGGGSSSSQQPGGGQTGGSGQTGTGIGGSTTRPDITTHGPSITGTPGATGNAEGQESQAGSATSIGQGQDTGSSSSGSVSGAGQGSGGESGVSETGGAGTSGECVGGLVGYNEKGQPIVNVCLSDSEEPSGEDSSGTSGTGSDSGASGTGGTSSTGSTTTGTSGTDDDETDDTEDATETEAAEATGEEGMLNPDDDRTYYTPPAPTADQLHEMWEQKGGGGDPAPGDAPAVRETHVMGEVDPFSVIQSHVDPYASYTGDETSTSGGGEIDPSKMQPPKPDQPVPDERGTDLPDGLVNLPSDPRVHPGGLNMGGTGDGEDGQGGKDV